MKRYCLQIEETFFIGTMMDCVQQFEMWKKQNVNTISKGMVTDGK
jgi:hypothetical protein